jgi:hypothetical protein
MTTVSPLRSGAAVGALAAFTQYLRELQAKALATAVGDTTAEPSLAVAPSTASSTQVSADAVTATPALPSWQGPGTSAGQHGDSSPAPGSAGSGWPQAYGVGAQSGVGSVIDLLS